MLPALDVPALDMGWPLIGSLVLVLAAPRWGVVLHGALLLAAIAMDQMRLQPEFISLWILMLATLPAPGAQLIGRMHLVCLWFFSGFHKLFSAGYYEMMQARLWQRLLPAVGHETDFWLSLLLAVLEMLLGVLALLPRTRRLAAMMALPMHAGIIGLSLLPGLELGGLAMERGLGRCRLRLAVVVARERSDRSGRRALAGENRGVYSGRKPAGLLPGRGRCLPGLQPLFGEHSRGHVERRADRHVDDVSRTAGQPEPALYWRADSAHASDVRGFFPRLGQAGRQARNSRPALVRKEFGYADRVIVAAVVQWGMGNGEWGMGNAKRSPACTSRRDSGSAWRSSR